jgi:hypothetical protein
VVVTPDTQELTPTRDILLEAIEKFRSYNRLRIIEGVIFNIDNKRYNVYTMHNKFYVSLSMHLVESEKIDELKDTIQQALNKFSHLIDQQDILYDIMAYIMYRNDNKLKILFNHKIKQKCEVGEFVLENKSFDVKHGCLHCVWEITNLSDNFEENHT